MRRTTTFALTAALALGAVAATDGNTALTLTTERVWAHCGDTQKVSNVEGGTPFAADTTPPAASFSAGGGCGTADAVLSPVENEAGEFLEFTAAYTGELDSLTIELHMIDAGIVRVSETAPTGELPDPGDPVPGVAFDEIYADTEVLITAPDGSFAGFAGEAQFPSERSETGISTRLRMTITDLGLVGDPTAEHVVTVKVKTADYYNGDSGGWVLDATEVPTGITFNPAVEDWAPYQVASI